MSTPTVPATYAFDPAHSRIGFVARHAMVTKVRGSFNQFDGSGYFDAANPASSKLQLTIEAASIDTPNADRDAHLRSNAFSTWTPTRRSLSPRRASSRPDRRRPLSRYR